MKNKVQNIQSLAETKFLSLYNANYINKGGNKKTWTIATRTSKEVLEEQFFNGKEDKGDAVVILAYHKEEILSKLEILKELGIDGVECYYPANSDLMTETCLEFCKENNMIITAGSDGHGDFGAVSKGVEYYIGAINKDSSLLNIEKLL